ncbi:MAG: glutamine amidotransferase [Desulfuromonadales bacterium]
MKLTIIKTGTAFDDTVEKYGDFDQMICRGLGLARDSIQVINAFQGEALPHPSDCSGVVITGAHCMVTDNLPWSLAIEKWIPAIIQNKVPLLGICYGHQLLGRAMGGLVDYHPRGKELGTVDVRLSPAAFSDPLFSGLPQQFPAHVTHSQSVLSLPPEAILLAENDFEPHQAFRIGGCAWGVQYHPEFSCDIMRDYILKQQDQINRSGRDAEALLRILRETPQATSILGIFANLALERWRAWRTGR